MLKLTGGIKEARMSPSKPDYWRPQSWVISRSRLYMPAHTFVLLLCLLCFFSVLNAALWQSCFFRAFGLQSLGDPIQATFLIETAHLISNPPGGVKIFEVQDPHGLVTYLKPLCVFSLQLQWPCLRLLLRPRGGSPQSQQKSRGQV